MATIRTELARLPRLSILLTRELSEAPLLGDDNLLATGELVLAATEGLLIEDILYRLLSHSQFLISKCHISHA